jgi:hypothetical protein
MRRLSTAFAAAATLAASSCFSPACGVALAAPSAPTPACAARESRQFDFWLGEWDVFDAGGKQASAWVEITPMLDGCAIRETYRDAGGQLGESLSAWDAARRRWHQTWMTNRGAVLRIDGEFADGVMTLSGEKPDGHGGTVALRATWRAVGAEVHHRAETSADGGKTWSTWFDLVFRRRAHAAS